MANQTKNIDWEFIAVCAFGAVVAFCVAIGVIAYNARLAYNPCQAPEVIHQEQL